jgi:plastocyanin
MRRETLASAARSGRALARRRIVKAAGVALPALALAALVGAGQSAAQYNPYATGTMPTSTDPITTPAPIPTLAENTVTVKGSNGVYRFRPRTLNVRKGTRVKWSWNSDADHNVTFAKLRRHSKTGPRGSYRLTFHTPGTYRYLCTIHGFTGKIVVR